MVIARTFVFISFFAVSAFIFYIIESTEKVSIWPSKQINTFAFVWSLNVCNFQLFYCLAWQFFSAHRALSLTDFYVVERVYRNSKPHHQKRTQIIILQVDIELFGILKHVFVSSATDTDKNDFRFVQLCFQFHAK
ncbi:unnamed protein product [Albugo candida]|uniref:Uncharacterized protein n=1 Tax=Albugo candida TaxID=65357 RepID=A0A024FT77_9STRA|nr:unnamed protein product [Albugo candida]|eukprot:CCI10201.1 unnamed protein product [Albugo candida]